MGDIITRKCACCKGEIEIDVHDIKDVIFYNKLYYHANCFEEMAKQKAASKRGKPQMWQEALDRLWELEAETNKMLKSALTKDELNDWLLAHYDVAVVPVRLWQIVADLERGAYKGKRCRPVSMEMLLGVWKWGQRKLDEIAANNRANHKGPADDNARLVYDLAILVGKVPSYLTYKEKQKTTVIELARNTSYDEVDMSRIGQQKKEVKKDISDIFNDLYVEQVIHIGREF